MNKLAKIDEIYRAWLGGFVNGSIAMSDIGKILDTKIIKGNDGIFIDAKTNKVLLKCKSVEIEVRS